MILLIHSLNDVNKNSNSHKIAVQLLKKYKDIINHQYMINIDNLKYLYLFNCSHRQWIKQNMYDGWKKTRGNIFDNKGIAKQISNTLTRTKINCFQVLPFDPYFNQGPDRCLCKNEYSVCSPCTPTITRGFTVGYSMYRDLTETTTAEQVSLKPHGFSVLYQWHIIHLRLKRL